MNASKIFGISAGICAVIYFVLVGIIVGVPTGLQRGAAEVFKCLDTHTVEVCRVKFNAE